MKSLFACLFVRSPPLLPPVSPGERMMERGPAPGVQLSRPLLLPSPCRRLQRDSTAAAAKGGGPQSAGAEELTVRHLQMDVFHEDAIQEDDEV